MNIKWKINFHLHEYACCLVDTPYACWRILFGITLDNIVLWQLMLDFVAIWSL